MADAAHKARREQTARNETASPGGAEHAQRCDRKSFRATAQWQQETMKSGGDEEKGCAAKEGQNLNVNAQNSIPAT